MVITLVAVGLVRRRQYGRRGHRAVMQVRVAASIPCWEGPAPRTGLVRRDMPVVAAMVALMHSQRRRLVIVPGLQPIIWLFNGVIQHGFLQWPDLVHEAASPAGEVPGCALVGALPDRGVPS